MYTFCPFSSQFFYLHPFYSVAKKKSILRSKKYWGRGTCCLPPPFPYNLCLHQSQYTWFCNPSLRTNYKLLVVKVKLCIVMNSSRPERQTDDDVQAIKSGIMLPNIQTPNFISNTT